MAEALYRRYRPQVFEDVVGQEPIERTLKNASEQDKVSHAYLFTGPRGTGKTTTARLLAKALLCEQGPTPNPDGTCGDCLLIAEGTHPDVYELDAASRTGVENVREEIISRVQFAPTRGRYKVYIIDEVHMLSTAAFNALLKTLEEPPSHVVFILCTTDPQKVPETIHSRCQRFDFRRIAPESMVSRLGAICMAEDVEFEGEALDLIAHRAEGGLRNALTSLEQIIAFENGKVTLAGAERLLGAIDSNDMAEIMALVGKRDIANCFRWTANYVETGADLAQFVRDMAEHVRNLYVMALVGDDVDLDVSETTRRELANELQWYGSDRLSRLLGVLGDLSAELKTSSNPRLAFEIALTRMVRPDSDLTLESLAERLEALESGYSAVSHVIPDGHIASKRDQVAYEPASVAVPTQETQPAPAPAPAEAYGQRASAEPEPAQASRQAPVERVQQQHVQPAGSAEPQANQAEEPAPVAAVSTETSPLSVLQNPAALQRIWQAALSAVKKQKQAYGVLFMNSKVSFDAAEGMLTVAFPSESMFAFNAVQKPDVQDALAAALERAVGASVPFCYEQAGTTTHVQGRARQAESPRRQRIEQTPQVQSQPQPQPQPQSQPEPQPKPEPQPQPEPAPQPQSGAPQSQPVVNNYDDVPYEQVPYDDIPYDPVPYDDFGEVAAPASRDQSFQQDADTATGASPIEPNLTPEGAIAEKPDDIQAMLQAGFGGGVVFSEVDE
ncbi:MAG: DNA polymerase III subunit gamma/tau [Eggerthellaceae bacterium]|nr:DNA polymerase III subunit gamma/tau [Eggerthellaceae bacterium]